MEEERSKMKDDPIIILDTKAKAEEFEKHFVDADRLAADLQVSKRTAYRLMEPLKKVSVKYDLEAIQADPSGAPTDKDSRYDMLDKKRRRSMVPVRIARAFNLMCKRGNPLFFNSDFQRTMAYRRWHPDDEEKLGESTIDRMPL